jgi:phosphoglycolate phosphatase-like HAD superfamily hydrolase
MKLILFDIDGTLISSGGAGTLSLNLAFQEVFGMVDAFRGISMAGKTDIQIIREGLWRHGLSPENGVVPRLVASYLENLEREVARAGGKHLKPGVREALETLAGEEGRAAVGLLTGNLEQGARIKLEAFGLNGYFRSGAFGSDDEDRNLLLPVAVRRFETLCGRTFPFRDCIIVGDTPRDVECAKRYDAFCIAVATGPYDAGSLRETGADVVMEDLSDTAVFCRVLQ